MLSSSVDTLYTFWDNNTHYKTESVHFLGPMNSATNSGVVEPLDFKQKLGQNSCCMWKCFAFDQKITSGIELGGCQC